MDDGIADHIAVGVSQPLVDFHHLAGVSRTGGILLGRGALGHRAAGLIDCLGLGGAHHHRIGIAIDAGGIGTVNGDVAVPGAVALGQRGDDLDGIVGAVLELEVQAVAVNGGVHAGGQVTHVVFMLGALHRLQIGLEGGGVDGGGQLTHAAGPGGGGGAAHIGAGLQVAARLGIGSAQGVIGKYFAGQQNGAVDPLAGQVHIMDAVGVAGGTGRGLAQHIGEQIRLQLGGGDRRLGEGQRDGDRLPLFRSLQRGLGGFDVKADAGHRGDDLFCGLIQGSVRRFFVDGVVDGLKIRLRRGLRGHRHVDGRLGFAAVELVLELGQDLFLQLHNVDGLAGGAVGQLQGGVGHGIGGLHHAVGDVALGVQNGLRRLVKAKRQIHFRFAHAKQRAQIADAAGKQVAAAALLPCVIDCRSAVGRQIAARNGKLRSAAGKGDGNGFTSALRLLLHLGQRLGPVQTAQLNAAHRGIGQHLIAHGDPSRQAGIRRHQNRQHDEYRYQRRSFLFCSLFRRPLLGRHDAFAILSFSFHDYINSSICQTLYVSPL